MLKSLLLKEWIKLRVLMLIALVLEFAFLGYFWYELEVLFANIEPTNMMWHRFIFFDFKPYEMFKWFFYALACVFALVQFFIEFSKNRLRIIAHLPLSLFKTLNLHLFVGVLFLGILFVIFSVLGTILLSFYYIRPIFYIFLQDSFYYFLGTILVYLFVSSAVLQKDNVLSALKLLFGVVCLFVYVKFTNISGILFILAFFILCHDSFLSVKNKQNKRALLLVLPALFLLIQYSFDMFKKQNDFLKYYLFYSPITKEFVYQKNFGEHKFEYGIVGKNQLDSESFEANLPFINWANLELEKKLPVKIDDVLYDKKTIKNARLTLNYNHKKLNEKYKILLPLINSLKHQALIVFPDNSLFVKKNGFSVYHHDKTLEQNLTNQIVSQTKDIKFPIKNIWGRFTNIKSFDLGYFIQDAIGSLYNLKQTDSVIKIKQIKAPKNLASLIILESKKSKIQALAIDENSQVYIMKDFKFNPIKTPNFNHEAMSLQLFSNPLYYQIRYHDDKKYHISVYDRELNFIKTTSLD